jgi:hypothetical protein
VVKELNFRSQSTEPKSQEAKPGVQPLFYITNAGGEPLVKPGVWRPEMWDLDSLYSYGVVNDGQVTS